MGREGVYFNSKLGAIREAFLIKLIWFKIENKGLKKGVISKDKDWKREGRVSFKIWLE